METMSFTRKEFASKKKVFSCLNFITTVTLGLKPFLNLQKNLRLPK